MLEHKGLDTLGEAARRSWQFLLEKLTAFHGRVTTKLQTPVESSELYEDIPEYNGMAIGMAIQPMIIALKELPEVLNRDDIVDSPEGRQARIAAFKNFDDFSQRFNNDLAGQTGLYALKSVTNDGFKKLPLGVKIWVVASVIECFESLKRVENALLEFQKTYRGHPSFNLPLNLDVINRWATVHDMQIKFIKLLFPNLEAQAGNIEDILVRTTTGRPDRRTEVSLACNEDTGNISLEIKNATPVEGVVEQPLSSTDAMTNEIYDILEKVYQSHGTLMPIINIFEDYILVARGLIRKHNIDIQNSYPDILKQLFESAGMADVELSVVLGWFGLRLQNDNISFDSQLMDITTAGSRISKATNLNNRFWLVASERTVRQKSSIAVDKHA